ncbi:hypothetical protein GCM10028807_45290 [Spirosoma daeguense]
MDDKQLIALWQSYDKKLDESLVLNQKNAEDITTIKVQHLIKSMNTTKLITIAIGVIWVSAGTLLVGNLFLFAFDQVSKFFLFSAAIQLLLTLIAIVVYLYQLILIHKVNSDEPIIHTQEKLARLKVSTLWVTRILFLQLPVWTTFYLSERMFINVGAVFYVIQIFITLVFSYVAVWLFLNIKYENRHKKWFRLIFDGKEWTPLMKSMELLSQLHDYRNVTDSKLSQ